MFENLVLKVLEIFFCSQYIRVIVRNAFPYSHQTPSETKIYRGEIL